MLLEEYPVNYYLDFLEYVKNKHQGDYWPALPRDVVTFWIKHMK